MSIRETLCIVMIAASATAAFAQDTIVTTHRVKIFLVAADCDRIPEVIFVVVGNKDRDAFAAERSKDDHCRWDGTKKNNPPFRIDSRISVRLTGARSDCRVPIKLPGDSVNREPIASLTFPYKPDSARQLKLTAEDKLFVSYERKLPADTVEGSLPCHEMAAFDQPETIRDVAFPNETLLLRFGNAPWIAFDSPLQKVLKEKKEIVIGPSLIGDRWFYQQKDKSRIKANELDTVTGRLEKQRMPNAKVEVQ